MMMVRPDPVSKCGWSVLGLALLTLTAGSTRAEEPKPKPKPFTGRVVDKDGAGVAGATVWLVGNADEAETFYPETVALKEAVSGPDGSFALEAPPRLASAATTAQYPAGWVHYDVIAKAKDGRLGWVGRNEMFRGGTTNLQLPLVEFAELRGRVVDQDGKPIAGAEVVPTGVYREDDGPARAASAMLPTALARSFRVVTGPDGQFSLARYPKVSAFAARVQVPGTGAVEVNWPGGEPPTIAVDRRVGRITGRLKLPDGARLTGTSKVMAYRFETARRPDRRAASSYSRYRVPIAPDGSFRLEGLQPGQYNLNFELDPAAPFVMMQANNSTTRLAPGATVEIPDIPLRPAILISGRVVDAETEKGVEGVGIYGYAFNPEGGPAVSIQPVKTDREGRYRLKGAKGTVQIQVVNVPRPYVTPNHDQLMNRQVDGPTTWPDVKLSRGLGIDGVVVDGQGRPVPGADLYILGPVNRSMSTRDTMKAGTDGTFRLEQLPDGPIAIRAWVKEKGATSNGAIVVRAKDVKGKLTIAIDPKFAFRMRGTVTDRLGKPIRKAQVSLHWTRQMPSDDPQRSGSTGTTLNAQSTDEAGRFDSGPLFPGDQYMLMVNAEGYAPFNSTELVGTPGMNRGLGRIKLAGTNGHLAGVVVGSDGKPMKDVTVFNRGNGLAPVTTKTGADGRFRLEKLFPGHKYAFARKDGYRFTAVLADGDRDDLTIRLLRKEGFRITDVLPGGGREDLAIRLLRGDEPPPAWKPEAGPSADEQRALARRILVRLWESAEQNNGAQIRMGLVQPMARIDPALALEWSTELGGQLDSQVRLTGAEVLADHNPEAAIEVSRKAVQDPTNLSTLLTLATWYAESDPARALAFAREGTALARKLGKATPLTFRARLGEILFQLGQIDEGKKLIEEAAVDLKAQAAPGQANARPFVPGTGAVARALALFDPKRALALLEGPGGASRIGIAASVAATDPARAVEMVKDERNGQPQRDNHNALIELVYRCGAVDADQALRVVDLLKDERSRAYQPEALGWLAVAVAKRDPKRAFALIDQALDLGLADEASEMPWRSNSDLPTLAARVALCARKIGYPDMESVLARVLAARSPAAGRGPWTGDAGYTAATLVSLLDPATAREMLLQAEAGTGSMPMPEARESDDNDNPRRRMRVYRQPYPDLMARVLAGGADAHKVIDDVLSEIEKTKGVSPLLYPLTQLATVLSSPPARREELLWGQQYDSWYPGRMSYAE